VVDADRHNATLIDRDLDHELLGGHRRECRSGSGSSDQRGCERDDEDA
jgi:hypothetical protein